MSIEIMVETVKSLVKQGYLTAKQGEKLPGSFALKVGKKNKKKNHKPVKSLSANEWEKKKAKAKKNTTKKNVAYYKIPVNFEISGNFIGYIKFKRAISLSNKMLNFDKETIKVVKGNTTGTIKVNGTLTIVGLADDFS